jgi:hypothetical protein
MARIDYPGMSDKYDWEKLGSLGKLMSYVLPGSPEESLTDFLTPVPGFTQMQAINNIIKASQLARPRVLNKLLSETTIPQRAPYSLAGHPQMEEHIAEQVAEALGRIKPQYYEQIAGPEASFGVQGFRVGATEPLGPSSKFDIRFNPYDILERLAEGNYYARGLGHEIGHPAYTELTKEEQKLAIKPFEDLLAAKNLYFIDRPKEAEIWSNISQGRMPSGTKAWWPGTSLYPERWKYWMSKELTPEAQQFWGPRNELIADAIADRATGTPGWESMPVDWNILDKFFRGGQ